MVRTKLRFLEWTDWQNLPTKCVGGRQNPVEMATSMQRCPRRLRKVAKAL